jgi:hypothetical protein
MADNNRMTKFLMWAIGLMLPVVVLIGAGLINMNSGLAVAQNDIADLEDNDVTQDEIIDELPAMGQHLESIDLTLVEIKGALKDIGKYIQEDSIRDAKSHHSHSGRDGQ